MDINILVRPVYRRQRTQLTGISELNVSYALCVPMGTYIKRVGLYAGITKVLTCYEIGQQADYNYRLERLLIEASVIPSLLCPTDKY
jgi:hypothetical protein